jgi:hypothetical protein
MLRTILIVALLAAGGCYVDEYGYYGGGYAVVSVAPGVSVVTDADYPVFYADNTYWLYDSGYWYRNNYYGTGAWVAAVPPIYVRNINNPYAYAHYHPYGYGYRRVYHAGYHPGGYRPGYYGGGYPR